MAKDFRTKQIRTNKIIGRGVQALGAAAPQVQLALMKSGSADFSGGLVTAGDGDGDGVADDFGRIKAVAEEGGDNPAIGTDVWMVVDGNASSRNKRKTGETVLFLGDVVISGTLYTERQRVNVTTQTIINSNDPVTAFSGSVFIDQDSGLTVGKRVVFEDSTFTDPRTSLGLGRVDTVFFSGEATPTGLLVVRPNLHDNDSGNNSRGRIGIGTHAPDAKLEIRAPNGVPHLKLRNIQDANDDSATFTVLDNGALTIATTDHGGTTGHFVLDADGDIELDSATGITKFRLNGNSTDLFTIQVAADGATTMSTVDVDGTNGNLTVNVNGATDINSDGNVTIDALGASSIGIGTNTNTGDISIGTGNSARSIFIGNNTTTTGVLVKSGTGNIKLETASVGDIKLDSSDNIDIDAADEITIDTTSADGHIAITSAHGSGDSIIVSANADPGSKLHILAGVKDVDVQGAYTLNATGVTIDSDGAAAGTVAINASNEAGGISVDAGTAGIAINSTGQVHINSTLDGASAIKLLTNSGTSESIVIQNAKGTAATAIAIAASKGGMQIQAEQNINLDADGGIISFKDSGVQIAEFDTSTLSVNNLKIHAKEGTEQRMIIAVGANGATTVLTEDGDGNGLTNNANYTLMIGGNIELNSATGAFRFAVGAQQVLKIEHDTGNAGDAVFKDGGGEEIFRLDNDANSLLMAGTNKIEFNDATQFIHAPDAANLTIAATTDINLEATTVDIDATTVDISNNLVVNGNLTVSGTTTTISTTNLNVEDALIVLQAEMTGESTSDLGIIMERGTTGDNAAIIWDEGADTFLLGTTSETGGDADVTVAVGTVQVGKLEINGTTNFIGLNGNDLEIKSSHVFIVDSGSGKFSARRAGSTFFRLWAGSNTAAAHNDDAVFISKDGNSIFMIDTSAASLLMRDTTPHDVAENLSHISRKIEFCDADTFIHQSADKTLKLATDNDGTISLNALNFDFEVDGAVLKLGADDDVTLTHVADTGLLLNSSMQLQFGHADENISGDGTNLTVASGGDFVVNSISNYFQRTDNDAEVLLKRLDTLSTGEFIGRVGFVGDESNGQEIVGAAIEARVEAAWQKQLVHLAPPEYSAPTSLRFRTFDGFQQDFNNPPERMIITNSGKVGIGVSDPDSQLEVLSTGTQQKWSYDADSFAKIDVLNASHTAISTGESGNFEIDAANFIELDAGGGLIYFNSGGAATPHNPQGASSYLVAEMASEHFEFMGWTNTTGTRILSFLNSQYDTATVPSIRVDTDKKLTFREATTFIQSPSANTLDIETGTTGNNNGVINIGTDEASTITIGKAGVTSTEIHGLTLASIQIDGDSGSLTFAGAGTDPVMSRDGSGNFSIDASGGSMTFTDSANSAISLSTLATSAISTTAFQTIEAPTNHRKVVASQRRLALIGSGSVGGTHADELYHFDGEAAPSDIMFFVSGSVKPVGKDTPFQNTGGADDFFERRNAAFDCDLVASGSVMLRGLYATNAAGDLIAGSGQTIPHPVANGATNYTGYVMQIDQTSKTATPFGEAKLHGNFMFTYSDAAIKAPASGDIEFQQNDGTGTVMTVDPENNAVTIPTNKKLGFQSSANTYIYTPDGVSLEVGSAESVVFKLDTDDGSTSATFTVEGAGSEKFKIEETGNVTQQGDLYLRGGDLYGAENGSLTLRGDTDVIIKIDDDDDDVNATGRTFQVQNGSGSAVLSIDEAGDATLTGELSASSLSLTTDLPLTHGGTGASSASAARTNLGLAIGTDVQAHGDVLDDLNTLGAASSGNQFIVSSGAGAFSYLGGSTARTAIGLGTTSSPQFSGIQIGHASDTTITRMSAGKIEVEGVEVLLAGAQTNITTDFNTGKKVGRDANNLVDFTTNNETVFRSNGEDQIKFTDGAILPMVSNLDLGSSANRFANIYTNDLNLCNEGRGNDVDGTSGNWTIQEGEDDLYVINNLTGKKFRMMLQPVEDGE